MDSRSAAIALLIRSGRRAGPSSVAAPAGARPRVGGSPVCPHRSRCSRSPIEAFTMTDPGVHDPDLGVQLGPICAFTMERSGRSRWTETRNKQADGTRKSLTALSDELAA